MLYFKTIKIENSNTEVVEKTIRAYSLKRHAALDLNFNLFTAYQGINNKYFYAQENDREILLTRIRTPFAFILPKLIVRFKKEHGFTSYKIRYSLPTMLVNCLYIYGLFGELPYNFSPEILLLLLLILLVILLFTRFEVLNTRDRINKAIEEMTGVEFLNV
jgi:hypothetical protein